MDGDCGWHGGVARGATGSRLAQGVSVYAPNLAGGSEPPGFGLPILTTHPNPARGSSENWERGSDSM